MKKFILIFFLPYYCIAQQGIAISEDGSMPSPAAIFDINSASKGFLLPRMSQSQRIGINNPENGLLVFENDQQRLYQYRNGQWQFFLDNSYWIKSTSRKWLINFVDSIGIGTAAPVEKFHIANGNVRLLNGDMKVDDGNIFINSSTGKLQFLTGGLNKAFLQLSSNDVRIGTNAENEVGAVRLASGGLTKVTIDDGGLSMSSTSKLTRPETGEHHLAAYCYGIVESDGSIYSGTGNFQVTKQYSTGSTEYRITVEGVEAYTVDRTVILITPRISNVASFGYFQSNNGYFLIKLWDKDLLAVEGGFNFVIYNK